MQRRQKSKRHAAAANARWRAAEVRAQAERDAGIPDREPMIDYRQPIRLDLKVAGYRNLHLEPRIGYVAWRMLDADTGERIDCAALKTLLHRVADELPRTMGARA